MIYSDLNLRQIFYSCGAFFILATCGNASTPITTCAIRWDAWYTNGPEDPAKYTAAALSALAFHPLAPLHATFTPNGTILWAASQATFDAEIRAAHIAGLCWAYVMYGRDNVIDLENSMMRGLAFHRASQIKSQVNYSMIISLSLLDRSPGVGNSTRKIVELIADPNYQRITINGSHRPLLFLFYEPTDLERRFDGSLQKLKQSVDTVRELSIARGLENPYLVVLFGPAQAAEKVRAALGADAISEYVAGVRTGGVQEWGEFETTIEADWADYISATSIAAIPTLRSGADIRARCESPPPFEHRFPRGFDCRRFYVKNPTLEELGAEFRAAAKLLQSPLSKDPAALLLAYAWSECDESGNCLMPTYGDPSGNKIKYIATALR